MRYLYLLLLCFLISCKEEQKKNDFDLKYISHNLKLSLLHVGEECGEWGGDSEEIIFYRNNLEKVNLLADYKKINFNCKDRKKDSIVTKGIIVTRNIQRLILESINELTQIKISRENYPSHAGLYNRIQLSDSTLIIDDFPSQKWITFEKIADELLKR